MSPRHRARRSRFNRRDRVVLALLFVAALGFVGGLVCYQLELQTAGDASVAGGAAFAVAAVVVVAAEVINRKGADHADT